MCPLKQLRVNVIRTFSPLYMTTLHSCPSLRSRKNLASSTASPDSFSIAAMTLSAADGANDVEATARSALGVVPSSILDTGEFGKPKCKPQR